MATYWVLTPKNSQHAKALLHTFDPATYVVQILSVLLPQHFLKKLPLFLSLNIFCVCEVVPERSHVDIVLMALLENAFHVLAITIFRNIFRYGVYIFLSREIKII